MTRNKAFINIKKNKIMKRLNAKKNLKMIN